MSDIVLIPKNNEVIVYKSEWLRGNPNDSLLFAPNTGHPEKRCCLGFWCNACGLNDKKIEDISDPQELVFSNDNNFDIGGLTENGENTPICKAMMMINDNEQINDFERERILATLAKSLGVTMTFID